MEYLIWGAAFALGAVVGYAANAVLNIIQQLQSA